MIQALIHIKALSRMIVLVAHSRFNASTQATEPLPELSVSLN